MNKVKRILIKGICGLVLIGIIAFVVISISKDIQNNSKRAGFDSILTDKDFCTLAVDGDTIWGGGANGLFKIDRKTMQAQEIGRYQFVRALLVTTQGLWIGHENGLTLMQKDATTTYSTATGALPDNRVNALERDRAGNLWIGTWGGAVKYDGKSFTTFSTKDGLLVDMINVIRADSSGAIWFGSYVAPRGGICVLRNAKWQYFTPKDALLHANINAIIQLQDGSVLAGGGLYTSGGGTRFVDVNGVWTKTDTLTKADGLAGEKVRSLFQDRTGRLWIGSEYDGAVMVRTAFWGTADKLGTAALVKLDTKSGLHDNEVKVVVEDASGNIWFGARRGITRISKDAPL